MTSMITTVLSTTMTCTTIMKAPINMTMTYKQRKNVTKYVMSVRSISVPDLPCRDTFTPYALTLHDLPISMFYFSCF